MAVLGRLWPDQAATTITMQHLITTILVAIWNRHLSGYRKYTKVPSPKFWQVRKRVIDFWLIWAGTKDAIEAAKLSKELAAAAGNDEYVK